MQENNFKEQNSEDEKNQEKEEVLEEAKKFEKSPWIFLIRKSKLTYLIIIFLFIFGMLTISNLPRELQPEVEIPYAVVATAYPGASPLDVEQQVTKKIENQISNISGIKQINSTSSLGISTVTVEFEADEDLTESIRKLQDEVQKTENDLPDDAITPQVIEISFSDQAIFVATLSSDQYDVADLKQFAENLKDKLKGIPYVSEVKVVGGRERIVEVNVDQQKIAQHNISLSSLTGILSANNFDLPAGTLSLDNYKYSLRVVGEFNNAQEVAKIPIAYEDEKPILLEDVATVKDGFSKETSKSRLSINQDVPKEAVSIQLYKKTGGDITEVASQAAAAVENGRGIEYPEDVGVEITTNNADYITESINTLSFNGLETVMIILLLLFVFLGWREALLAGLAVPFSFFISFIVMSSLGESLNFLSLFALVLALGLLVDSAIVVVEGMYRKVGYYGISGYNAAILTIKEYAAPLLSGMLTTVAAFFPLMFVIGIIGEFLKVIPIVVNSTLIAALFVALTIIPAIGALILKPKNKSEDKEEKECKFKLLKKFKKRCSSKPREHRWASRIFNKISRKYYNFIPRIIGSKRNRRLLLSAVGILFVLSMILPISGLLKIQSFSSVDSNFFFVNIEMPKGSLLEKTDEATRKVEEVILQEENVVNFTTSVGSGMGMDIMDSSGGNSSTNEASIKVNLVDKNDRDLKSHEILSQLRPKIEKVVTEAKISFVEEESGPPGGAPIELRVVGDDLLTLENLAQEIKNKLAAIPTVIEAQTSVKFAPGEFVFIPNKDILSREGLSVAGVAGELRTGVSRNDESEISKDGDEIKINIGFDEEQLKSFSEVKEILITTPTGKKLAISELGEIKLQASLSSITRRDKERVVTVTAKTDGGNATEITQQLQAELETFNLPSGYRVDYGGEQEDTMKTFRDMFMKMIIGIILILFILIIQFNSYKQVLIILSTIPLALIGVFIGMAISRLILDIPAFIGIVSLAGIVVNNSIILVDQINKEIRDKKRLVEAVQHAGFTRLRPIILTSITTIFGLLPLSITQPDWRNMGFTIIFGLTFSGFLTLFVVPSIFVSFYRKKMN